MFSNRIPSHKGSSLKNSPKTKKIGHIDLGLRSLVEVKEYQQALKKIIVPKKMQQLQNKEFQKIFVRKKVGGTEQANNDYIEKQNYAGRSPIWGKKKDAQQTESKNQNTIRGNESSGRSSTIGKGRKKVEKEPMHIN